MINCLELIRLSHTEAGKTDFSAEKTCKSLFNTTTIEMFNNSICRSQSNLYKIQIYIFLLKKTTFDVKVLRLPVIKDEKRVDISD